MILVEKHIYRESHKHYQELDNLCFLSKNLYNATLYEVRQYYFANKKYLSYSKINKQFSDNNQTDYRALPSKVSQHIQKLVDSNFKSFFVKRKTDKEAKMPKYLPKDGRQELKYTKQAISFKNYPYIKLSQTNITIKTKIPKEKIQCVIISHCKSYIQVMVGYKEQEQEIQTNNNKYASIDLGVNNLMTVTSTEFSPIIINGRPIKSINQYYNKQKAKYQSELEKCNQAKTSARLSRLSFKRKNKIDDYFHKSIFYLMNQLVENNIHTLVIGYNKDWKQDINIGKVNNQNFVSIPFYKLLSMLQYKCQLFGITLIVHEESYTSKCSFLDKEPIKKHDKYVGKRVHRGLFKTAQGKLINADVNGSLNILRKVVSNIYDYIEEIEVCSMPKKYNF